MEKRKYLIGKKMSIKNMLILILLFTVVEFCICSNDITMPHRQTDFSMLSCTEMRNITLVLNIGFFVDVYDTNNHKFVQYLNDFITNEYCFYVNVYDNSEDRMVRVRNSNDLSNIIERNSYHLEVGKLVELVDRLYEEKIFGDADGMKQSFIVINFHINYYIGLFYLSLSKMQNDRKWDIIIMLPDLVDEYNLWLNWLPLHRYIQMNLLIDINLINLIDVIKNPDYDRYEAAYRWISSRNDLFNSSCFGKINKITFLVKYFREAFFPMTLAVLRKENDRREREKLKPLKMVFYSFRYISPIIDLKRKAGGEYVEFVNGWNNHHLHNNYDYTKNEKEVFINVIDWNGLNWLCVEYNKPILLLNQDYHYREFKETNENCYIQENIKTFGSMSSGSTSITTSAAQQHKSLSQEGNNLQSVKNAYILYS
uniref:Uncharacterized protein n=1 Tax=Clytia hemisphaerica TaxID=252671 RepID=A0A7M5X5U4_9CNID